MKTKERLAKDLKEAKAPPGMVQRALGGYYDDYESPLATPIIELVADCKTHGLKEIAKKAKNGVYDGTREEGEAWFEAEGHKLL